MSYETIPEILVQPGYPSNALPANKCCAPAAAVLHQNADDCQSIRKSPDCVNAWGCALSWFYHEIISVEISYSVLVVKKSVWICHYVLAYFVVTLPKREESCKYYFFFEVQYIIISMATQVLFVLATVFAGTWCSRGGKEYKWVKHCATIISYLLSFQQIVASQNGKKLMG